jgi:hypothetical protein
MRNLKYEDKAIRDATIETMVAFDKHDFEKPITPEMWWKLGLVVGTQLRLLYRIAELEREMEELQNARRVQPVSPSGTDSGYGETGAIPADS